MRDANHKLEGDLSTVVDRLGTKLIQFKGRKKIDQAKAITGHYGLQSHLKEIELSMNEGSYDDYEKLDLSH